MEQTSKKKNRKMLVGNKRQRMKKIRETYFRERAILKYASVETRRIMGEGEQENHLK